MKFLLCWLGHGYPCKVNPLKHPSELERTWITCKQVTLTLCWALNESPSQCLMLYFPLPAFSFWVTISPDVWKNKWQWDAWSLCDLANCEPASLLGKVLGKEIQDNGSRCCQYSALIFLSSAMGFCLPHHCVRPASSAHGALLRAAPVCSAPVSAHLYYSVWSEKALSLAIDAEHLKIIYTFQHFINLFMQGSGQISSFCRHKKIFFAWFNTTACIHLYWFHYCFPLLSEMLNCVFDLYYLTRSIYHYNASLHYKAFRHIYQYNKACTTWESSREIKQQQQII